MAFNATFSIVQAGQKMSNVPAEEVYKYAQANDGQCLIVSATMPILWGPTSSAGAALVYSGPLFSDTFHQTLMA